MRRFIRTGFLWSAIAAAALPLFSQGNSDVFLSSIGRDGDKLVFAAPVKINERTGYNNQPSFHPDGSGVFYSSADGTQTDIFFYVIGEKRNDRLTTTSDSEYSPLVTPAGNEFSVIQLVLAEGPRKGAQPLLAFPIRGGSPRILYEAGRKIGYHAWIDGSRLAAFVLGEPNTLQLIDLKSGEARILARNIGRSLYSSPGAADEVFFSAEGIIKKVNIKTNAVEDVVALKDGDFFCPVPGGGFLTAAGADIFLHRPGRDETWVKVGDFSAFGIQSISRLAVDPFGRRLAFVSASGSPGGRRARPAISFNEFHTTTAVTRYLREIAAAYPEITELEEIGRSNFGRPIHVLTVTNRKTGRSLESLLGTVPSPSPTPPASSSGESLAGSTAPSPPLHLSKPGHWICGSTHGNEFTGTEVCLYIIDKLVSGYRTDPAVRALVDTKVFYICPVVNPDGHFNSTERGISQRQNSRWRDDDRDGRVNEDGPDDLNGDGFITQFRFPDPDGRFVIDETDPRIMIRLGNGEKTEKPLYSVILEDRDNDGDGKRGEDPEAGIDINRNFPIKWYRDDGRPGGTGDFPASSPEVKAFCDFYLAHRNILLGQNYHTSGGFTYRPMGSAPHTTLAAKDVAVLDFIMGRKYLELIGEDVPEAWQNPDDLEKFKAALAQGKNTFAALRGYEFPRGWKVSYDELSGRQYGFGLSTDWEFRNHGSYSITTELWNPDRDIPGFPKTADDGTDLDRLRALLAFQDVKYEGKLFIPWKTFTHPELGPGEIGGWKPAYQSNAWPGEPLLHVCETHWKFELFRAGLLPEVVVSEAKARVIDATDDPRTAAAWTAAGVTGGGKGKTTGRYRAVEVTARIENKGALATHLARGVEIPGNREDLAWLVGGGDQIRIIEGGRPARLGVLEGAMKIPGYREPDDARKTDSSGTAGPRAKTGPSGAARELRWLVVTDGRPPLKIVVSSQKGGTTSAAVAFEGDGE